MASKVTQSQRITFLKGLNRMEKRQLARVSNDPLYPGTPALGGRVRLVTRDALLRDKGGVTPRRNLDLYYDLLTDWQAYADWDKQITTIVSRPWFIEPGGKEPQDIAAADLAREMIEDLGTKIDFGVFIAQDRPCSGFDALTRGLLLSTIAGIGVGEIIWDHNRHNKLIATQIPVRDARRFVFDYEEKDDIAGVGQDDVVYPKLLTTGEFSNGVLIPARKFIFHRHYSIPGLSDHYGFGLGRQLFYPVEWKKELVIMWLNLIDKYIDPVTVGTHPLDADKEDVAAFKDHIMTIAQEMSITLPEGWSIEFLRADINQSYMALESFINKIDQKISKIILGEATTGEPMGGSQARETINNSIRLQKAKAWADELSETLNCTLMTWMTQLNFRNARPPKIWRDFKEDVALQDFANLLVTLNTVGYQVDPKLIEDRTGLKRNEKAPLAPAQPGVPTGGDPNAPGAAAPQQQQALLPRIEAPLDPLGDIAAAGFSEAIADPWEDDND